MPRLLDFVAEAQKNTYLGLLTGTGLILAMIVQPIAGAISDRSGFGWGAPSTLHPAGYRVDYTVSALTLFIIGPMIDFLNAYSPGLGYQTMFLVSFTCLVIGSLLVLKIKGQVSRINKTPC